MHLLVFFMLIGIMLPWLANGIVHRQHQLGPQKRRTKTMESYNANPIFTQASRPNLIKKHLHDRPIKEKRSERSTMTTLESEIEQADGQVPAFVPSRSRQSSNEGNGPQCWVCYAYASDDEIAEWVHPCRCRGTTSSVHVSCLQRWIDEKQKGNPSAKVNCPQCGTDYIILYPRPNLIIFIMEKSEVTITKCCPLLAAGVLLGSVYWCAVTYGVIVVLQIFGYEKGMEKLENVDPFLLLLGLPIIPIALIAGKMVRWEQSALQFLHRYVLTAPKRPPATTTTQQRGWEEFRDPLPATRVFIGALMLPTFAVTIGSWLKPYVPSAWQRALVGGAAFVAVKGLLRIYYQHQQMKRTALRRVKNFPHEATAHTQTDDYEFDEEEPGPSYDPENDYSSSSEQDNID